MFSSMAISRRLSLIITTTAKLTSPPEGLVGVEDSRHKAIQTEFPLRFCTSCPPHTNAQFAVADQTCHAPHQRLLIPTAHHETRPTLLHQLRDITGIGGHHHAPARHCLHDGVRT